MNKTAGCLLFSIQIFLLTISAKAWETQGSDSRPYDFAVTPDSSLIIRESRITAGIPGKKLMYSDTIPSGLVKRLPNVADAIRLFSGIQLKDYGGIGGLKTINIRSLGSEYADIFIDGIPVVNAQNMQVDLGRFSNDIINGIRLSEVCNPEDLLTAKAYSSAASVFLSSTKPVFKQGRTSDFRMKIRGGSFDTFSPSFTLEHMFVKGISGRLNAGFVSSSGKYKFHESKWIKNSNGTYSGYDTTMTRKNGDISSFRTEGQLYGNTKKGNWNTYAYYYDSERGLPGAVVRRASDLPDKADRQTDKDMFIQGKLTEYISNVYSLSASFKLSHEYLRYMTNPESDPQSMPADNKYNQTGAYLSFSNRIRISRFWKINTAADIQYDRLGANLTGFVYPRRVTEYAAVANTFNLKSLYINLNCTYTIAYDKFKNGASSQAGGFAKSNGTRKAFSPLLSFSYAPPESECLSFTGFVKKSYRMPSFNDLYYTLVGNSNLECEKAWQYGIGGKYLKSPGAKFHLENKIEIYYNSVKDKIVAIPTFSQFRWTMFNIGKAGITGAEINTSVRYDGTGKRIPAFGASLKYTFQKATDYSDPGNSSYKGQIPYIPLHSGSLSANVGWNGWNADLCLFISGKKWSSSANIPDYEIEPWKTGDLHLVKEIEITGNGKGHQRIAIGLSLNNLFNEQYEIVQGYPMPGFNYSISLEYRF
ncbi:MAG: TonB-dependent receptor [Bacteroidales bacterium]|jgi:hypothetical protein|nr:TonB-dependent receptor [Bacteroidales bacterium]MCI1785086.1 TonB-dependent receptor [Bacteroidales bacterium]